MKNFYNSKGQLVRIESFEREQENLIVSKWNGGYVVVNLGKQKKSKKKEIEVRSYKVTQDENGEGHCNCISHSEKNEFCKHMIAATKYAKRQNEVKQAAARQEEEERTARVMTAIARW